MRWFALVGLLLSGLWVSAGDVSTEHVVVMEGLFPVGNRWEELSPEFLREFVYPQTSLGEAAVDWLPVLRPIAESLTAECASPLEAARALNRSLWERVGVIYSPKREKANQDPLHSMRIGLASCSGLSILLVDACRSVGIPARVVGCWWRRKPGNHSWVEVWSEGAWTPLGAAEDVPPEALWFLQDAADAVADEPQYAIYAARASLLPEGTRFYGWGVPAENVTARYAGAPAVALPPGVSQILVAAERSGVRVAEPFTVNGVRYVSPGPDRDLNDYTVVQVPSEGAVTLDFSGYKVALEARPRAIVVVALPSEEKR